MPYADPEKRREVSRRSKARAYADPERRAVLLARQADYYRETKDEREVCRRAWTERNRDRVLQMAGERYRRTDPRKRFAQRANRKTAYYGRPDDVLDWKTLPEGPWSCHYCGVGCESWDHVEQLALGGANKVENLVPSCVPCNQKRPRRLRAYRKRLTENARSV